MECCYSVLMHPYLSEQLGAAYREDLMRVAASLHCYREDRLPTDRVGLLAVVRLTPVRRRTGTWLVRAGQRLGGLDSSFGVGLNTGQTGTAC